MVLIFILTMGYLCVAVVVALKRMGITTGAAAAAAAKAAAMAMLGNKPSSVTIPTPVGLRLEIPVEEVEVRGNVACATVRKFSGDNPDILDGVEVRVCVEPGGDGIEVRGGAGVGVVTRPGLPVPVGEYAINPVARSMIINAVREAVNGGLVVTVEVPRGAELWEKTMNKDVGIIGGVSILGTTGIEMPISDEDYIRHIRCELEVVRRSGDFVVIAPGNKGVEFSRRLYGDSVVKVGDRIGDSVKLALKLGFRRVVVAGLPGKIVKLAAGLWNTHSSVGDARVETITHAAVLAGLETRVIAKVAGSLSVEEAIYYLGNDAPRVMEVIAKRVLGRLERLGRASYGVVIFNNEGSILAKVGDA